MINFMFALSIGFSITAIALLISVKMREKERIRIAGRKFTKEEMQAFEVFADAMNKGLELTINGEYECKPAEKGWFYVNGKKKRLNIQNYLEILKGVQDE